MKTLSCLAMLWCLALTRLPAQTYCQPGSDLFLAVQPEAIDSVELTYATNQWSVDEWDNISCTFPVQQCENLGLSLFYPVLTDPQARRPLVVLIHGGGFVGGSRNDLRREARNLARLGYVAATISYRLCKRNNCNILANLGVWPILCNANFWADFGTGAYVATHDALNAIRYLQQQTTLYPIDPETVIVGGVSAGGWTALQVAYLSQAEVNTLGGWASTWGAFNPVTGINGVFNIGGALLDTAFIQPNERIPAFLVHGVCDPIICYDYDAPFHCNSQYPALHGSAHVAEQLCRQAIPYYLFTGEGMGHDAWPLYGQWWPQMLVYMKGTMLCHENTSHHQIATLSPASAECNVLAGTGQPNPPHTHAPRTPINLAGCAPVTTSAPQTPQWRVFPSLIRNEALQIQMDWDGRVSIVDAHGRMHFTQILVAGQTLTVEPHQLAPGLNVVILHGRFSQIQRVIKLD